MSQKYQKPEIIILLQYFPMLNHTYQFLTIPNNTWQIWYQLVSPGINKASSITAITIPVLWRYRHNTVLMIFVCLLLSQYRFRWFSQNLRCSITTKVGQKDFYLIDTGKWPNSIKTNYYKCAVPLFQAALPALKNIS